MPHRYGLRDLAAAGQRRRVHGGAPPLSPASGRLAQRDASDPVRKAALVARAVMPGGILFLGAGATNLAVAPAPLAGLGITVVTNAPQIAVIFATLAGVDPILIGGRVDPRSGAATGTRVLRDRRGLAST